MILLIETSASICSAAICSLEGNILQSKTALSINTHSEELPLMVNELIGPQKESLKAVAVSKGPGSYTGLRIGTSLAKGLCFALQIPLISVNAFKGMARYSATRFSEADMYIAMLDARRNDVYFQTFAKNATENSTVSFMTITEESFANESEKHLVVCGNSNDKWRMLVKGFKRIDFVDCNPDAMYLAAEAVFKFEQKQFEDVAYFEPFYLKDFIPGVPKKFSV